MLKAPWADLLLTAAEAAPAAADWVQAVLGAGLAAGWERPVAAASWVALLC